MWLGIIAGIFTSISLLPQIIKVQREKKADDISIPYLIILTIGQILWIIYGITKSDVPVIATNSFAVTISIITIVLGLKYKKSR